MNEFKALVFLSVLISIFWSTVSLDTENEIEKVKN